MNPYVCPKCRKEGYDLDCPVCEGNGGDEDGECQECNGNAIKEGWAECVECGYTWRMTR